MRCAWLVISVGVTAIGGAQVPKIETGTRVRVDANHHQYEGTLMAQTADSLTIADRAAVHRVVAASGVSEIKVDEGKTRGRGAIKGAKIGAVIGGGLGLFFGAVLSGFNDASSSTPTSEIVAAGAGSAVWGALWGAGIGALVRAEKWSTVYSGRARLTLVAPRARSVGVAVTY